MLQKIPGCVSLFVYNFGFLKLVKVQKIWQLEKLNNILDFHTVLTLNINNFHDFTESCSIIWNPIVQVQN